MKSSRRMHFLVYLCFILPTCLCKLQHVHKFDMADEIMREKRSTVHESIPVRYRRSSSTQSCHEQEEQFLKDVVSGKVEIAAKHSFANDSSNSMALAWAGKNGGMLVITSRVQGDLVLSSSVFRSVDYGVSYKQIKGKLLGARIRKHNGVQRNPYNPDKIYLIADGDKNSILYITEDAGETYTEVPLDFVMLEAFTFHNKENENYLIARETTLSTAKLHVSMDNGRTWRMALDFVQSFKWGTSGNDKPATIYAMVDPSRTTSFLITMFYQMMYDLKKSSDGGRTWTSIMKNVVSFGHQGKFLYATVIKDPNKTSKRIMKVSSDGGKVWYEAQLPTLEADMFYSVMDMQEDLVFMHVDDPGDTGHGTLYTSANKGVIYSTSLQKHLYPNYGDVTDFYRVESMRGVYLASQMSSDDSIHTVITFNQGATWQNVSRPSGTSCKDEQKNCNLQIHGTYSLARGILAQTPFSAASAIGIILVHGHVADALQTTHPDVFISSDGGYNWRKALDGPHHYHIADSGSLIVAVPSSTDTPKTIKFSTDEGRCWHEYDFIKDDKEKIKFTGLITEPGSASLSVSVWGYHPTTRVWTSYVIDLKKLLKKQCGTSDYEHWMAHESLRKDENANVRGCLMGERETFTRLKKDAWCYNGEDFNVVKDVAQCTCTREDYECDYGYYRQDGSIDCVKNPSIKELDICLQGREEEIITVGYRKIPGDKCVKGFEPVGKKVQLAKACEEGDKSVVDNDFNPPEKRKGNWSIIAAVVVVIILVVLVMVAYFGYQIYVVRKHKVVYRYSLLNQNEAQDYDNEFENALTNRSVVYQDSSDDEELNSPAVKKTNGKLPTEKTRLSNSSSGRKVRSYHDDSDVDMLE